MISRPVAIVLRGADSLRDFFVFRIKFGMFDIDLYEYMEILLPIYLINVKKAGRKQD